RSFASIEDLKLRVPHIQKSELTALAAIGSLNFISGKQGSRGETNGTIHRRDALWQIERASRRPGPLLETLEESPDQPLAHRIALTEKRSDDRTTAEVLK